MINTDLKHLLRLQKIPNIGDINAKKLITRCGSAEAVFNERRENLKKIDGIGEVMLSELFNPSFIDAAEQELTIHY